MDYSTFYQESLKAWTELMMPTISAETFTEAVGASADFFLAGQKKMRDAAVQTLETSEVPTQKDFARLAQQVELAEQRSQECEARLDEAVAANEALEQRLRAALATLEAAQEAIEKLEDRLHATLDR